MGTRQNYVGKFIKIHANDPIYGIIEDVDEYGWTYRILVVVNEKRYMHTEYHHGDLMFRNHASQFHFNILTKADMLSVYREQLKPYDEQIKSELIDINENDVEALFDVYKTKYKQIFIRKDVLC